MKSPPLIVIPARMQASRLPGKPLADIAGKPMIQHVWDRAREAGVGRVVVATDARQIFETVKTFGGEAVMTSPDHPSGSDRVNEAVNTVDPDGAHTVIINLQGDLPSLDPGLVTRCHNLAEASGADIATLAAEITDPDERDDPNVVKVVGANSSSDPATLRALYFTRATAPYGDGPLYHHIGIYAYQREALSRFVSLPASGLEQREKLEQLRALEAGMSIAVAIVDTVPVGVDTPADLEQARKLLFVPAT